MPKLPKLPSRQVCHTWQLVRAGFYGRLCTTVVGRRSLRRFGAGETQRILGLIGEWPTQIVHSTDAWRHEAADVKATAPVSVADAWICGLARLLDAELVHKDPEFDRVPKLKRLRLPYKPKTR